ncbi:TetR/AcrR family transcriptional regulator [Streptomyces sp. MK37H]|uniref:TetR/AcrR family transcriptional regulator n=1 Tax=Streptomyces sp. MK37H TaxID=2699117 RepID=UPI001B35C041|nr:TetR/AcrR family transcriptional regulator [Streptomyces sp. MK37H]MBP8533260.1 TetR family transcriptional regulator [Streptomyces sp. MK37H]
MAQTRAALTRRRVLLAAAVELANHGYTGTSLARVASQAGVTLGALTFHFPTKPELAHGVYEDGAASTRAAIDRALGRSQLPLQNVIDITHEVSRLLRADTTVQAASRLSREAACTDYSWHQLWLSDIKRLADKAHARGDLGENCSAGVLCSLVVCMLARLDSPSVYTSGSMCEDLEVLSQLWCLVLGSVAASCSPALLPGGSPR